MMPSPDPIHFGRFQIRASAATNSLLQGTNLLLVVNRYSPYVIKHPNAPVNLHCTIRVTATSAAKRAEDGSNQDEERPVCDESEIEHFHRLSSGTGPHGPIRVGRDGPNNDRTLFPVCGLANSYRSWLKCRALPLLTLLKCRALPLLKCRALEVQSEASHRENQQMAVLKDLLLPVNLW